MSAHEPVAWVFLSYLAIPVVAWFVFWFAGFILRKVFKKGGADQPAEGE